MKTRLHLIARMGMASLLLAPAAWSGEFSPPSSPRTEVLERPDGRRLSGKMSDDPQTGFRFKAVGAAEPIRLEPGSVVAFEGPGPEPTTAYPPFRLEMGLGQRISGRLGSVDETEVAASR